MQRRGAGCFSGSSPGRRGGRRFFGEQPNNTGGTLQVKGEKGNSLTSFDTNNLIDGYPASDNVGAPDGTQKQIFSVTNIGDRLFLRLRVTKQVFNQFFIQRAGSEEIPARFVFPEKAATGCWWKVEGG